MTDDFVKGAEIEAATPITVGPLLNPAFEELAQKFRAETAKEAEGTLESLGRCAAMLDAYAPDLYPPNEHGQVHFARAMMESVADEIKAFLAHKSTATFKGALAEIADLRARLAADGKTRGFDCVLIGGKHADIPLAEKSGPAVARRSEDTMEDDDFDDDFDPDGPCPECGDGDFERAQSACIDDLCHGGEVPCMHGDWSTLPCSTCGKRA